MFFGENFDENYIKKIAVPNCLPNNVDAKLSVFTMLVPNCPFSYFGAELSVCLLGAKLSVFTILVPSCPGAQLSGAKLSYHPSTPDYPIKK